jgi:prepilin-type N-terminal cleavage/methylation domain-containing protein
MIKNFFKGNSGFTLVEMMVVVLIFSLLFGIMLTIYLNSYQSWRTGRGALIEQQEARRAMDNIVSLLRPSSPTWGVYIGGTSQDKIQFNTGSSSSDRVIFKINPTDPSQLIKQVGPSADWIPVANEIQSIRFSGGDCSGCVCLFVNPACDSCTNVTNICPVIKIEIVTKKEQGFTLVSYVTLRNADAVTAAFPEPPATGEF